MFITAFEGMMENPATLLEDRAIFPDHYLKFNFCGKEYQNLLGNGKITTPKDQPECGTYFDEGITRYLTYPNLKFELNDKKEVAWLTSEMPHSSLKIQTDKGTITEKTTLEELKSIFYKSDSWWIADDNDGTETFVIPDGFDSDDQLHILFDKNGKLLKVSLFVPC